MTYQPEHQPPPGYVYPPQPPAPRRTKWWVLGAGAAVILAGVATVALVLTNQQDSPPRDPSRYDGIYEEPEREQTALEAAREACAPLHPDVQIGDEGRSVEIQTLDADAILLAELGREDTSAAGATLEEVGCILDRLDTPDSVIARMDSTRALDGMQDATWDGYAAVWTYHPDDGLNLIIEQTS